MGRIVIVSNVLPLKVQRFENHEIILEDRIGGFSSGMRNFHEEEKTIWLGSTGFNERKLSKKEKSRLNIEYMKRSCTPVYLKKKDSERHLAGFSNNTIWPVFHYFQELASYKKEDWAGYVKVNKKYADEVAEIVKPGDRIWIHDYHLMLLPKMLREKFPDLSIGYFQHIPFPSFEIFRLLPYRMEILEGLLGADLIGFHTYDYERHFLSSVRRLTGLDTYLNQIRYEKRVLKVENFPMGIDYEKYHNRAMDLINNTPEKLKDLKEKIEKHIRVRMGNKIVLSIDWLDFTKGWINRVLSFKSFLEKYPHYHGNVSLLVYLTPPNGNIAEFISIKSSLDEHVGRINSEFGRIDWTPIYYFYTELSFDEMIQVYLSSDVALITPIRDGMNLIAKEYIASRPAKKGVLILSELAGASKEMGEALIVNPNSHSEVADALDRALSMTEEEIIEINTALQKRLSHYTDEKWARDFISSLDSVKKIQEFNLTRKYSAATSKNLIESYKNAEKRMIFLDYDGTLQGFFKNPQDARPDKELYDIIKKLCKDKKNQVVIISGRDKETLSDWFEGDWRLGFIAEHGVWYREEQGNWNMLEAIDKAWMDIIRSTLDFYVDRTPRSFIEEKNYSLVWHYRKSDPDLGVQRSIELKDELQSLVANLNLEIMDGDKVIEIKNSGINKGRAAQFRMGNDSYQFILAMGDDWTDEYTFDAMPVEAFTIKVGTKSTKAKYYVENYLNVREILKSLVEAS